MDYGYSLQVINDDWTTPKKNSAEGIAAASFCEAQRAKDTADSPAQAYFGTGNEF